MTNENNEESQRESPVILECKNMQRIDTDLSGASHDNSPLKDPS